LSTFEAVDCIGIPENQNAKMSPFIKCTKKKTGKKHIKMYINKYESKKAA
jgi:hypothetical protein